MSKVFTSRKKATLLSLAVVTALAMPVYAEDEAVNTRDVLVTASRTEQEVKETPSAVEVITREDLDKIGAHNLADALQMATSINVGGPAMAGRSVSIRGMTSRHALILVNGKRLVSENSQMLANVYELDRINVDNVERIEIVRGPVSSLYGSDALGGVINIITRKSDKEQFTFSLSPQRYTDKMSVGADNYFIRYDSGQKGKWQWSVNANRTEDDNYENNDGTSKNRFGSRDNFGLEATYTLSPDQYLDFGIDASREDLKTRTNVDGVGLRDDRYDNSREQYSIGLRGKTKASDYQIRTYYGVYDKHEKNYPVSTGLLSDFTDSKREVWALEGHVSTQLNDKHLLTTGGELRTETLRGTAVGSGKNPFTTTHGTVTKSGSEADIDYSALYIQDEWLVNDRVLLIPSVRYDDSDRFSGNVSPKLGMTYKMNETYRLKANIGKGFKAPSLDDMYNSSTRRMGTYNVRIVGNPDLRPEKSTSYEIGIEGEKGKTSAKLTYFVNDVSNLIKQQVSYNPMTGIFTSTYINEDKAEIDGLEFEIGRKLSDKFALKLNYTYLDATGTTGQRLTDRARHQGSIQLHYDDSRRHGVTAVLWNEWRNDYLYAMTAAMGSAANSNKTYSLWNIGVNKKWNDNFSSHIGIDNIFNKKDEDLHMLGTIVKAGVTFKL